MKNNSVSSSVSKFELLQEVNNMFYFLSHTPILKKFFFEDLVKEYESKDGLVLFEKTVFYLKALSAKIMYIGFFGVISLIPNVDNLLVKDVPRFGYVFLLFTLMALFIRGIIDFDGEAYDSVMLMHANAEEYSMGRVHKYLFKELISFSIAFIPIHHYLGINYVVCILFLLAYLSLHLFKQALDFMHYTNNNYEGKFKPYMKVIWGIVTIIAIALLLLQTKFSINNNYMMFVSLALLPFGIWGYYYLRNYKEYKKLYRYNIKTDDLKALENIVMVGQGTYVDVSKASDSLDDTAVKSKKSGYAYIFDVFMQRNRKTFRRGFLIRLGLVCLGCIVMLVLPLFAKELDIHSHEYVEGLYGSLQFFIIIIYFIANINKTFTINAFLQIDRNLISYHFFRRPSDIAKNFLLRIKHMSLLTMTPVAILSLTFLAVSLFYGNLPTSKVVILFIFPLVLGMFYTVYNLAAYYLMQPFSYEGKVVNRYYPIVDYVIYALTYATFHIDLEFSPLVLSIITAILLVVSIVLFVLVIKRAPKNFRVR